MENFQHSPACAEFLQGLPENDKIQASLVQDSSLRDLSLDDGSLSPPPSRLLTFRQMADYPTPDLGGRVTFPALMIPRKDVSMLSTWYADVHRVFGYFIPCGCDVIKRRHPPPHMRHLAAWFMVITEDASGCGLGTGTVGHSGRTTFPNP